MPTEDLGVGNKEAKESPSLSLLLLTSSHHSVHLLTHTPSGLSWILLPTDCMEHNRSLRTSSNPILKYRVGKKRVVSGRVISLRLQTGIPCLSQPVLTISCIDGLCNKHIAPAKQIIFHIWNWRIVPWGFYLFSKQLRLSTSLGYVLLVRKTETICAGQISLVWGSEWGWGELIHPRFPALQPPVFYISHL